MSRPVVHSHSTLLQWYIHFRVVTGPWCTSQDEIGMYFDKYRPYHMYRTIKRIRWHTVRFARYMIYDQFHFHLSMFIINNRHSQTLRLVTQTYNFNVCKIMISVFIIRNPCAIQEDNPNSVRSTGEDPLVCRAEYILGNPRTWTHTCIFSHLSTSRRRM